MFLHCGQHNRGGNQLMSSVLYYTFKAFHHLFMGFSAGFCVCVCVCVFEDCFIFFKAFRLGSIYSAFHLILSLTLSHKCCWLLRLRGRASLNRKSQGCRHPARGSATCWAVKAVRGGCRVSRKHRTPITGTQS